MDIVLDRLYKSYGTKAVLEDFSLVLPERGTVALMGQSGCGKTTLLRVMAGLERLDGGSLRYPKGTKISMVFQEDRLLEVLSARDNLLAVMEPGNEALADRSLAELGLEDAAALPPSQLSGGMRRRLAVARAVCFGGDILLLDEPFKGLDVDTKRQVAEYLFRTHAAPRLTVLVTHDLWEVEEYAHLLLELEGTPLRVAASKTLGEATP